MSTFGTTTDDVLALTPETSRAALDRVGLDDATIERWIAELGGRVTIRCHGWDTLNPDLVGPDGTTTPGLRTQFEAFARTVVANGAAAYLEDARHPERAGASTTSYGAVLWTRFKDGLDELAAWLERVKADQGDGVLDDVTPIGGTLGDYGAGSFPPPLILDTARLRW